MTAVVLATMLTGPLGTGVGVPRSPEVIDVLARTPAYRVLPGEEVRLLGVLQRNLSQKSADPFYRLEVGQIGQLSQRETHYLHAPGQLHLLEPLVGKFVQVRGKVIRPTDGTRVWVGSIELPSKIRSNWIIARAYWRPANAARSPSGSTIIRSGEQLADLMRINGPDPAAIATSLLARKLGVASIDWKTQMVVSVWSPLVPFNGHLRVRQIEKHDQKLKIDCSFERLQGGGLTLPSETVLLRRVDGPVEVVVPRWAP